MNFFSRKTPSPISCYDVVAAYGKMIELFPSGWNRGEKVQLPYDVEIIKASLIKVAIDNIHEPKKVDTAKTGFVLLADHIDSTDHPRNVDLTALVEQLEADGLNRDEAWASAESQLLALVDSQTSTLEQEFEARLQFERSKHA